MDSIIYANTWSLLPAGIVEAASGAGLVLIVLSGGWMTDDNTMQVDVADLVVFLLYLSQIFLPFLRLANMTDNLQKAAACANRVFDLLDEPAAISANYDLPVPSHMSFDVAFKNVEFSYESDIPVLTGATFTVHEGGICGDGRRFGCGQNNRLSFTGPFL